MAKPQNSIPKPLTEKDSTSAQVELPQGISAQILGSWCFVKTFKSFYQLHLSVSLLAESFI